MTLGRILITGGASGLGAAVAEEVREAGGEPIVLDLQKAAGPDTQYDAVDLAQSGDAEAAVMDIVRRGDLDGVVTCAGTDACGPLEEVPTMTWDRVIGVNLIGTAAVARAALPSLRRTKGRLVTIASTLGFRAMPDATAYCASKFGVVGFTRALAAEMAGRVGVTLLIPGGMATHFFDDRDPQYKPGPDAQLNDPANVANAALFALQQPPGCEVKELIVTASTEPSYP